MGPRILRNNDTLTQLEDSVYALANVLGCTYDEAESLVLWDAGDDAALRASYLERRSMYLRDRTLLHRTSRGARIFKRNVDRKRVTLEDLEAMIAKAIREADDDLQNS